MSKLGDQFNNPPQGNETSRATDTPRGSITTRDEMERRITDRSSYPPAPEHNHPAPDWVVNPDDFHRQQMRKNERRINDLRNRLHGASRIMQQDFDQSR